MTGCKIGKVKLKNGAEVLRFPTAPRDDVQKALVETAAHYAKVYAPGELHGFIMIAWDEKTTISKVSIVKPGIVHGSTASSFAADEVRRALNRQGDW